jgi:hypothetical protein
MSNDAIIRSIREKFRLMSPSFTERTRRLWCVVEASQLGWGGVSIVQTATGVSRPTIRKGIEELKEPVELTPMQSRLPGGGRKKITEHYPDLPDALESLIDPVVRGDPESPLRWTCKSTRRLAEKLKYVGYSRRLWKTELQKLATFMGVNITVCHFPPGTSKCHKH